MIAVTRPTMTTVRETTGAAVLVADDQQDNRTLLRHQLKLLGHNVTTAADGFQALELLRSQPFDLVLLDMVMPRATGYEVLEQMKASPLLRHTPVLVVSVVEELSSIVRCIELGADDYLLRPINHVLLNARVKACLHRKWLHDQEQAAMVAIETANRAKSEFISMVAHELRTPMSAVRGYADLLNTQVIGPVTEDQASCLTAIRTNIDLMAMLVADLADISKIESGLLDLKIQDVSLPGVVRQVMQTVHRLIAERNQQLSLQITPALPLVRADATRLAQVLTNLLTNAAKYTPERGSITLRAERRGEMVTIAVVDTGIGIDSSDSQRVFEKFYRTERGRAHGAPGTGLGLSIARQLAELMGGEIWFESTVGAGTTFYLELPAAERI